MNYKSKPIKLLLIEESRANGKSVAGDFKDDSNFQIKKAHTLETAKVLLKMGKYDITLINIVSFEIETINEFKKTNLQDIDTPVIVVGDEKVQNVNELIVRLNAQDFIVSPKRNDHSLKKIVKYNLRLYQLNLLLQTISNINHAVAVEKDKNKLLQKVCDLLIEGRNHKTAWIGIFDENKKIEKVIHAGLEDVIEEFNEYLRNGKKLNCINLITNSKKNINKINIPATCNSCPLHKEQSENEIVSVNLSHNDKVYGFLVVSRVAGLVHDKEEIELLSKVSADIGNRLYSIEIENKNKLAEYKLFESQRFAESTLDSINRHISVIDETGKIIAVNQAWKNFAQNNSVNVDNLLEGANYIDVCKKAIEQGDKIAEEFLEKLNQVIANKMNKFSLEYPCHSPEKKRWFKVSVTRFSGDGPVRVVISHDNITKLILSMEKIARSEERYRNLYENSTVGMYSATSEGKLLLANKTFLNMMQVNSIAELQSRLDANEVYADPSNNQKFLEILEREGILYGFENEILMPDGSKLFIRESAKLVSYDDELFIEGVIENITEQKIFEQQLFEARNKAEQSDRLKSEFLAQMSHEIRTPLNSLMNAADLVKEEMFDEMDSETKEVFEIIESSGNRIINTIQEILNMSELQTESYELITSKFDLLEEVVYPVVEKYKKGLAEKKLRVNFNFEESDFMVHLDRYSILQIFQHLFDNAFKYTKTGSIDVNLQREDRELLIEIIDTGIGISDKYLKMIFEPFSQESQGYSRPYDGCGLGLALTKRYCELLGGRITINSERGKGTLVKVVIPTEN